MYRRNYFTAKPGDASDARGLDDPRGEIAAPACWGCAFAAALAPFWLSPLIGWAIGMVGSFGQHLMFPSVILITLVGSAGVLVLGGQRITSVIFAMAYMPVAVVVSIVVGWLGMMSSPNAYLY